MHWPALYHCSPWKRKDFSVLLTFIHISILFQVMTNSSLPSTLVKCLYLFFDLPILTNVTKDPDVGIDGGGASVSGAGSSTRLYSPRERRLLLQKMFIQVLLKLCTYQPAVEELARKDDLTLLFSAVTSECPSHNVMWRKTAADILLTISRHSLNQPVVAYLHGKYLNLNSWNYAYALKVALIQKMLEDLQGSKIYSKSLS